jgi:hypothetical protein
MRFYTQIPTETWIKDGTPVFQLKIKDPTGVWRTCSRRQEFTGITGFTGSLVCPDDWTILCAQTKPTTTACVADKYQPVTTATVTCSGDCLCEPSTGTFSGTISDGPSDYGNNAKCTWLIASSDLISLSFFSFNTEYLASMTPPCCDFVTINRCTSASSCVEQIAQLSGSSVSQSAIYTSNTGYMKVEFTSDGSYIRPGFDASWMVSTSTCTNCPINSNSPAGSTSLTKCTCNAGFPGPNGGPCTECVAGKYQPVTTATVTCSGDCVCQPSTGTSSGTISDGPGDYANNANCMWLIASSDSISLSFSSLDTESIDDMNRPCCDFVTINRCTSPSSCDERVARLSGSSVSQSAIYTSSTGYMQVVFTSDYSVVRSGFVASWFVPCTNCPTNSNSPAGSASLTSCNCNAGFPGPNGGPCRGCVAGKYLSAATVTCSGGCLCQPSTGTSSGTISDGFFYYGNNANCVWLIASEYGAVQLISSERKQTGKTEKGLTAHYLDRQTVDCNNEPIVGFGLERGRFSIRNVVRSDGNIDCNDQTFGDYSYSGNGKYCLCLLPGEGQTKNVCAAQDGVCTCPAGIVQYGHWDYAEIDYSYSCGLGGPFKDAVTVRDFLSFLSLIGLHSISLLIDTCSLCLPVPHGCRCKNKMEMRIFLHVI